jgi:hypothetical protein
MKLTTYFLPVPRPRRHGGIPPLPQHVLKHRDRVPSPLSLIFEDVYLTRGIFLVDIIIKNWDSSVVWRWATGWMNGGFDSWQGLGIFL